MRAKFNMRLIKNVSKTRYKTPLGNEIWKISPGPNFMELHNGQFCAYCANFYFKALLIKSTQKVKLTFQCLLYENELKKYKAFVNAQDGRLIFMLTCEYAYA